MSALTERQRQYLDMLAEAPTTATEAPTLIGNTVQQASAYLAYLCAKGWAERHAHFYTETANGRMGVRYQLATKAPVTLHPLHLPDMRNHP